MTRSAAIMMSRYGTAAIVTSRIGFLNVKLVMKRLSPTGGWRYPTSRLRRKMTPRWNGSTPIAMAAGAMSGTTTTMAEKMSITMPTMRSITLSASRKLHLWWKWAEMNRTISCGTRAVTSRLVKAWAHSTMAKMAPDSAMAEPMTFQKVD